MRTAFLHWEVAPGLLARRGDGIAAAKDVEMMSTSLERIRRSRDTLESPVFTVDDLHRSRASLILGIDGEFSFFSQRGLEECVPARSATGAEGS